MKSGGKMHDLNHTGCACDQSGIYREIGRTSASEIRVDEFDDIPVLDDSFGVIPGVDETAVAFDDQIPVVFLEEVDQGGKSRGCRDGFPVAVDNDFDGAVHIVNVLCLSKLKGRRRRGSPGCCPYPLSGMSCPGR